MWRASALSALALSTAAVLAAQTPAPAAAPNQDSANIVNAVRLGPGDSLGRLDAPEAAGRSVAPVTARDNSELVKAIEEKIRCTCGCNLSVYTCRTTDFTCSVSPAMHAVVLARLDSGMTEAQVLASFQQQYGDMIFMEPPKHGFNLLAYFMPFVGLAVGLGLVTGLVRRWFRRAPSPAAAPETADVAAGAVPAEDLERLKRELEDFEA
jgi:cytochrome c-type biogenesis protein CcmH/NrfF